MKKLLLVLLLVLISATSFAANDWGRTGHRVTGEIAQQHLTKKASKALHKLLKGQSLAFVSTYADEIKSDSKYRSYGPWHYVNFPFGTTYEDAPKNEKGDIIQAIEFCIKVLKDKTSANEDKVFHLKLLVHFLGDLHQPLHVGLKEDKGANDFQVRWFGDGANLHSVWDTKMIESYNMTYSELSENRRALSKTQIAQIKSGNVISWMYESRALCEDLYANVESGDKLGYRHMYEYMDIVRFQLQKGGIRLATILNDIYS